jgi:hypothetical protein
LQQHQRCVDVVVRLLVRFRTKAISVGRRCWRRDWFRASHRRAAHVREKIDHRLLGFQERLIGLPDRHVSARAGLLFGHGPRGIPQLLCSLLQPVHRLVPIGRGPARVAKLNRQSQHGLLSIFVFLAAAAVIVVLGLLGVAAIA